MHGELLINVVHIKNISHSGVTEMSRLHSA